MNNETKLQLRKAQAETSLTTISVTGLFKHTPTEAWTQGTNIRTSLRMMPEETRAAVISMIKKTVDFVDAKKTLHSFEDIALCAEMVFEIFPVLKLEEFRLICDRMKTGYYGNFYERLKAQEFRDCITKHEEERAPLLERLNKEITRGTDNPSNVPEYDAEAAKLAWRMKNNPFLIPGKNGNSEDKSET